MEREQLRGIIPAIITPFTPEGEVDLKGLEGLTEYLISKGVHGIMCTGGNGEFCHLLKEEKSMVVETIAETIQGKIPLIAGTAACGTKETIILTQEAQEAGAQAAIITPPYYFRLPDDSLYEHYKTVVSNVNIPVIVYNNPLYTGNDLTPLVIQRLAEVKGIIGLKQSNPDLGQLVEIIRLAGNKIAILTGIDSQFYPSLCVGAKGIFSTAACIVPSQMVELYQAFEEESYENAFKIHTKLQSLNRFLEYEPGYVSPCKEALKMLGLAGGPVRLPLPSIDSRQKKQIGQVLKELGLLPKEGQ